MQNHPATRSHGLQEALCTAKDLLQLRQGTSQFMTVIVVCILAPNLRQVGNTTAEAGDLGRSITWGLRSL